MNEDGASGGWAEIVGPCHTASSMARALGWTEAQVLQASEDLRLLAVRTSDGVLLYPAFQLFNGRVVGGLQEVLRVLATGTAGHWTWAQFLNVRLAGGEAQIQGLRAGRLQDVLRDARREAAAWRS